MGLENAQHEKLSDRPLLPVLMLSTVYAEHALRSGYGLLREYVPGAEIIEASRSDPGTRLSLLCARAARRFSFSRWYLGGSAQLEWKALRKLRAGFEGVVHSLWADHDLGYLDLLLRSRHKLCGTFHNCSDTLPKTIRFPSRLKKFAAIILMSNTQRPFFLRAGVDPAKLHTILHGVDTQYYIPRARHDDLFTVLSVGGYRRNFPLLAKVCNSMKGRHQMRFLVVAPSIFRSLFSDLPNVEFFSGISDAKLLSFYQSSSCLLHVAENATANNAVLEAMACGLPIISERLGGIPEYVTAQSSILVEPGNRDAIAAAVDRLYDSPLLQSEMREAARKRAEELDWNKVAFQD